MRELPAFLPLVHFQHLLHSLLILSPSLSFSQTMQVLNFFLRRRDQLSVPVLQLYLPHLHQFYLVPKLRHQPRRQSSLQYFHKILLLQHWILRGSIFKNMRNLQLFLLFVLQSQQLLILLTHHSPLIGCRLLPVPMSRCRIF